MAPGLRHLALVVLAAGCVGPDAPDIYRYVLSGNPDVYLEFDERAGIVSGSTGCNSFRATLQITETGTKTQQPFSMTKRACASEEQRALEKRLLKYLPSEIVRPGSEKVSLGRNSADDRLVFYRSSASG